MKKRFYLVVNIRTSWHQANAGHGYASSISLIKTEQELQQYLDKEKDNPHVCNVAYDLSTPLLREQAARSSYACKQKVESCKESFALFDQRICLCCRGMKYYPGYPDRVCPDCKGTGKLE